MRRTNLLEVRRGQIPPLCEPPAIGVADAAADALAQPHGNPYGRSGPLRWRAPWHVSERVLGAESAWFDVVRLPAARTTGHEDVGLFSSETLRGRFWHSPGAGTMCAESLNTGPLLPEFAEPVPYHDDRGWMSNSVSKKERGLKHGRVARSDSALSSAGSSPP